MDKRADMLKIIAVNVGKKRAQNQIDLPPHLY